MDIHSSQLTPHRVTSLTTLSPLLRAAYSSTTAIDGPFIADVSHRGKKSELARARLASGAYPEVVDTGAWL